jgi:transcriptional regulator with XRE-family HTH domain
MPSRERLRGIGLQQADQLTRSLGREIRSLRVAASLSQAELANAASVSRSYVQRLEMGRLRRMDLRSVAVLMAILGHKLVVKGYPVGEPARDAGQLKLLDRFNARVPPAWRRRLEAVMPIAGDLRAWDERLDGPVSIGVEAETKPNDLQATERAMAAKQRDSHVERMILLVSGTQRNRALVHRYLPLLRQMFPLDTREVLQALANGHDPGGNGLVLI